MEPILNQFEAARVAEASAPGAAVAAAAVEAAPKLSAEEMTRMRRQRDPNFNPAATAAAAKKFTETATGSKKRQGLGFPEGT